MSSQINWNAALRALETSQRDAQRTRRLLKVGRWLLLGALSCGFGWLLYLSVQQLVDAWRSGDPQDWDFFWRGALDLLRVSPLALLSRVHVFDALLRPWREALSLRQQVAEGDDERAPIVADQPLVPPDDWSDSQHEIGPLSRPRSGRGEVAFAVAFFLLFAALILAPFSLALSLIPGSGIGGPIARLGLVATTLVLALGGMQAGRTAHNLGRDIQVVADEHGLRWRRLAARHRFLEIPWPQARAFITVRFQRQSDILPRDMFILESPGAVLAWEVSKRSTPEQRAAHERLSRLIAARTHLPLRDLTSTIETALNTEKKEERKPELTFPLPPPGTNPAPAVGLPITIVERNDPAARAARRSAHLGIALSAVFMLPVLALYGAGWGLQQYQPLFYAGLVARVHAEKPLFHDALSQDDGQWCVEDPSADNNYERYFYAGGAYHLVGKRSDWFMYCWPRSAYADDAAAEVTVSAGHRTDDDNVGLLLRHIGTGNSDFEVFLLDTHGYWSLRHARYVGGTSGWDWNYVADGYTRAAHQGAGARNRLLVVQRSSSFLLYVNEQFVGSYSDTAAPPFGFCGVYVDSTATEGIFSDFTVYPAPSMALLSA